MDFQFLLNPYQSFDVADRITALFRTQIKRYQDSRRAQIKWHSAHIKCYFARNNAPGLGLFGTSRSCDLVVISRKSGWSIRATPPYVKRCKIIAGF
jgi:hypothetical protein